MTIRIEVRGDSLIDLADEVTEEARPGLVAAMGEASRLLRTRMTQILRAKKGGPSAPGESPAEDTGELAGEVDELRTTVRGNMVRGGVGVGDADDIEKVQSLEFGATGPDKRIMAARPFMRPAEESIEAAVTQLAERAP